MVRRRKVNLVLKLAIVASEIPQLEIAKLAKLTESRLSHIIRGHGAEPSSDEKQAIAAALGKSIDDLFPAVTHAGGARA